jgi:pimeloyl-ACP methyl ester carboxylesterase
MWDQQIDALSSRFRVIAPDFRGFGKSTLAGEDFDRGVSMDRYAQDVIGLLDWLQVSEPVMAAGFSMGGYVAWQLVLRWPDRVRAIVPVDTRAAADADEARTARIKMAEAVMLSGNSEPAMSMIPKLFAPQTYDSRPDVVEYVRRIIERQRPEAIAAAQRGMARREDVRGRLDSIKADSLCIVGVADAISPPAEMHEIARLLAKSGSDDVRIAEIENAGHMSPIENPSGVTEAIRAFASECYGL